MSGEGHDPKCFYRAATRVRLVLMREAGGHTIWAEIEDGNKSDGG
jgi:hypothetical protein